MLHSRNNEPKRLKTCNYGKGHFSHIYYTLTSFYILIWYSNKMLNVHNWLYFNCYLLFEKTSASEMLSPKMLSYRLRKKSFPQQAVIPLYGKHIQFIIYLQVTVILKYNYTNRSSYIWDPCLNLGWRMTTNLWYLTFVNRTGL